MGVPDGMFTVSIVGIIIYLVILWLECRPEGSMTDVTGAGIAESSKL